jgi:hypothetical protein
VSVWLTKKTSERNKNYLRERRRCTITSGDSLFEGNVLGFRWNFCGLQRDFRVLFGGWGYERERTHATTKAGKGTQREREKRGENHRIEAGVLLLVCYILAPSA